MIDVEYREDLEPVCPHCEKSLKKVLGHSMKSLLGKRYIYFCPFCHKVLGISHRKGFWMG
ncbi:MAG: hypothetical protein AB1656_26805 [Candidatus Omnitrophota bacterium]